jgi:thiamine-phosphate pyrophosphorylase
MITTFNFRVYLITDDYYLDRPDIFTIIENCLQAGVTALQYRAKNRSSHTMLLEAIKLKQLAQNYQVPLIINDRLDIALAVGAEGLHLGQDDLPLTLARKHFGGNIGISATNYAEGRQAILNGADCVGVGPIFPTPTKHDAGAACGTALISRLKQEFPAAQLVAIGGITLENAVSVLTAGADGLAVISAILNAKDPQEAVRRFSQAYLDDEKGGC